MVIKPKDCTITLGVCRKCYFACLVHSFAY